MKVNLQEILKLPCDDYDFTDEEWEQLQAISDASHERLWEKREKSKQQYEESLTQVTTLYRGEEFDLACLRALKLEKYIQPVREPGGTDKFPCILHQGGRWAWLAPMRNGDILYRCPHDGGYLLTLPQVKASLAYKHVKGKAVNILHDHNAEHMVWRLWLLWEAGSIELEAVS